MVHVPGPGCQRLCSRCRCIPRRRWGRSQRDLNKMQVRVELFCVFLLPRGRHGGGEHRLLTGAKDAVFGEHAVWSFCPQFSAGAYTVGEGGTGTGLPGWLRVKIKNVWNHQLDIPVSYVSLPKGISPCIYIYIYQYLYIYIYMNIILQPRSPSYTIQEFCWFHRLPKLGHHWKTAPRNGRGGVPTVVSSGAKNWIGKNHLISYQKLIILRCFWGYHHSRKHPFVDHL